MNDVIYISSSEDEVKEIQQTSPTIIEHPVSFSTELKKRKLVTQENVGSDFSIINENNASLFSKNEKIKPKLIVKKRISIHGSLEKERKKEEQQTSITHVVRHYSEINDLEDEKCEEMFFLSEENRVRVKKLEKVISQCEKKIKNLQNQEIDFDEEEDSSYLQLDRYTKKLVQLCQIFSDIVNDKMIKREIYKKQLRRKDICDKMSGIQLIDEAIINFINLNIKKINKLKQINNSTSTSNYLKVPDSRDILEIVQKCNAEQNLGLSEIKMEDAACRAFKSLGRHLKKKRIRESDEYLFSLTEVDIEKDPANLNTELLENLRQNKKEGDKKISEIFKKYVEKQETLSIEVLNNEENISSGSSDENE